MQDSGWSPEARLPAVAIATGHEGCLTLPPTFSLRVGRVSRRCEATHHTGRRAAPDGGTHMTRVVPQPRTPHLKKLNFFKSRDADPGGGRGLQRDKARQQTRSPCFPRASEACEESGGGGGAAQRRPRAPEPDLRGPHPRHGAGKPASSTVSSKTLFNSTVAIVTGCSDLFSIMAQAAYARAARRLARPGGLIGCEPGQGASAENWVWIFTERLKWPVTGQITYL